MYHPCTTPAGLDDHYTPPPQPTLVSPAPQRLMPDMSDDLQAGIAHLSIDGANLTTAVPPASLPFPIITDPPSNIPQSDDECERTLEDARLAVLASPDPETQLVWAADALHQVGINIDNRERLMRVGLPAPDPSPTEYHLRLDAMNIVTFLAEQHHPRAEYIKGTWLEYGRYGCEFDKKEAFRCYSRAADYGYARAEYRLGMLFELNNDPIKALVHYHRGAQARDAACLYRIGMMTLRGQHGQQQDIALGLDMICQSADLADENAPQGAYVWGMLLAGQLHQLQLPDGYLVQDEYQARIEIEKAAFLKFPKAQLKMGSAYELGAMGCDFSPTYSIHYYALAARQGELEAEMGISKWFLVGHDGLFLKNEEIAYQYAQRAAVCGFANAEFAMGYFNELGIHVPTNVPLALEWYKKADLHGNTDARQRISGISNQQMLSRNDHEKVALKRIKSQHGSQRGLRPTRFQQSNNGLPTIGHGQVSQRRVESTPDPRPPRATSTTPYPLDDRPPSTAPYPLDDDSILVSTTPYPLDDQPLFRSQQRHSSLDGYQMPENPTGRARLYQSPRPSSDERQRFPSGPPPLRPVTNMERHDILPGGRHVSSPVRTQHHQSPRRAPGNDPETYDASYDRRMGSQNSTSVNRPHNVSSPTGRSSPSRHNNHRRKGSYPGPQNSGSLSPAGRNDRRNPPRKSPTPSSAIKSRPQSSRPVGTGPKTFEEMGVPASKPESDCIVM